MSERFVHMHASATHVPEGNQSGKEGIRLSAPAYTVAIPERLFRVRCRSGSAKAGLQRPAGLPDGKQPGLPQQVCVQAHGVYSDSEAPRNRT